jgi:hypothetical protein
VAVSPVFSAAFSVLDGALSGGVALPGPDF